MSQTRRQFAVRSLAVAAMAGAAPRAFADTGQASLVIARGGAAGGWPALSRVAYEQAIDQGADFIEGGLVAAKDGALVVRNDAELSGDTDIAGRPEYAERRTTRVIDGQTREGWFAEDFSLVELKSLNLSGRGRDRPSAPGGQRPTILAFDDLIAIARAGCLRQTRVVGVYATLKHPRYFANLGLPLEPRLAQVIRAQGYDLPAAAMFVASEEPSALKAVAELVETRRVQRIGLGAGPADVPGATWADMLSSEGLRGLARQVTVLAPWANEVLDLTDPKAVKPSGLTAGAHAVGLAVHAWAGNLGEPFPPPPFRRDDARRLLATLFAADVDGVACDNAGLAARARSDAARKS